jgi:hypothetical protein
MDGVREGETKTRQFETEGWEWRRKDGWSEGRTQIHERWRRLVRQREGGKEGRRVEEPGMRLTGERHWRGMERAGESFKGRV